MKWQKSQSSQWVRQFFIFKILRTQHGWNRGWQRVWTSAMRLLIHGVFRKFSVLKSWKHYGTTGFFANWSIVFSLLGGAAQIWTGEWRFCRPLPYHLATAPTKNPVFSMLSRFFSCFYYNTKLLNSKGLFCADLCPWCIQKKETKDGFSELSNIFEHLWISSIIQQQLERTFPIFVSS